MEASTITRVLLRKWWMFLIVFAITVGATVYLTMRQTPVYRARTTYIMRLSSQVVDAKTISTSLDILNRSDELLGTYSEIAMSQMIKRTAGSRLELANGDLRRVSVSSRALPSSKILEISAEGDNPNLVHDFVAAIGEETAEYANPLYPAYQLDPLDPPSVPARPISPKIPLNVLLGSLLGAFFGLVSVVLFAWIRGDFKNANKAAPQPETDDYIPVRNEIEMLTKQIELMRSEVTEARMMIHSTELDARSISTILHDLTKNGNGYGKGR